MRLASSAWIEDSYTAEPTYLDTLETWFGAEAASLPLNFDAAGSRRRIDQWVERSTEGLIPTILPENVPNADTRVILVSAVYMKAQWWRPFLREGTHEEDFHRLDGTTARADLMTQAPDTDYVVAEDYDAAVLPYVGDLEMVLIVPHEGRFPAVRDSFDGEALAALDAARTAGHVWLRLPRFQTEATVDVRDVIEERLGVEGLFDTAGLDGIGPDLTLTTAVHATTVIVDEEGTEAAGATALGGDGAGMPEFDAEIIADRPFLYVIRDTTTGAILFVGQYVDPEGA